MTSFSMTPRARRGMTVARYATGSMPQSAHEPKSEKRIAAVVRQTLWSMPPEYGGVDVHPSLRRRFT